MGDAMNRVSTRLTHVRLDLQSSRFGYKDLQSDDITNKMLVPHYKC